MRAQTAWPSSFLSLLLLLAALDAHAWTKAKGYSDVWNSTQGGGAPTKIYLPAGSCINTAAASAWDAFSITDPAPACFAGTVIKKGVISFGNAGTTCTSTSATTGCISTTFMLPGDFPAAGKMDARLFFSTTTTTNTQTTIFTIATKCATPTGGSGAADNPATLNAAQNMTYTNGGSEVSGSLRVITLANVTTTGCTGGDIMHVRIGRDISDTSTVAADFIGLELTIYSNV